MAFENINPAVGIWLSRGLGCLLMPEDLGGPLQSESPLQKPATNAARRRPQRPAPVQAPPAVESAPEPKRNMTWKPLVAADWPPEWRKQLEQTKRGKIVWTYAELGNDLHAGKTPDPAEVKEAAQSRSRRSRILRSLIGALKYPAGTHAFWPCQLGDSLQPDLFWSGVHELGSRGVVILGESCAAPLLGIERATAFTEKIFRGRKVAVLRSLADYSDADNDPVVSFLRCSFTGIAR